MPVWSFLTWEIGWIRYPNGEESLVYCGAGRQKVPFPEMYVVVVEAAT
jgi:hypothetical protein